MSDIHRTGGIIVVLFVALAAIKKFTQLSIKRSRPIPRGRGSFFLPRPDRGGKLGEYLDILKRSVARLSEHGHTVEQSESWR